MKKCTLFFFAFAFIFGLFFDVNINFVGAVTTPAFNPAFDYTIITSTLRLGSTGAEVARLQTALGGLIVDGKFGPITRNAIVVFQTSHNLTSDGIFGPRSRYALFGNMTFQTPVISGVSGPQSLNVNQQGTWTVSAYDLNGGNLSYKVDWGDNQGTPDFARPWLSGPSATFTHSYSQSENYNPTFTVLNRDKSAQTTITVNVGNTVSSLRVTSPNGGENWVRGTTQTIKWTSPQYIRATYADINLAQYFAPCPIGVACTQNAPLTYSITSNIDINQNSYSWGIGFVKNTSPDAITIGCGLSSNPCPPNFGLTSVPDGQYIIQICEIGTSNCDLSDASFTITSSMTQSSTILVIQINGGLCIYGECFSQITIKKDGTFATEDGDGKKKTGALGVNVVNKLKNLIDSSDYNTLRRTPFTDICPTAYDGSEFTYKFQTSHGEEIIGSCITKIDLSSSLLKEIQNVLTLIYSQ